MNDMNGKHGIVCIGLLMMLSSCHTSKQITASGLQRKDFQTEVNGQHTDLFTLSNKKGMEVCITNLHDTNLSGCKSETTFVDRIKKERID